jgi:hypothetical protein
VGIARRLSQFGRLVVPGSAAILFREQALTANPTIIAHLRLKSSASALIQGQDEQKSPEQQSGAFLQVVT